MNALDVNRRVTLAFIDQNPVDIALIPRSSGRTATGGRLKTSEEPRASQRFSLIEPSDSGFRYPSSTSDGSQYSVDFMLLGAYDAVMEKDDVFVYEGREYKLLEIMPDNGYEKRAVVVRHGW